MNTPGTNWAAPEKFFLVLDGIPQLKIRLQSWLFIEQFDEIAGATEISLKQCFQACKVCYKIINLNIFDQNVCVHVSETNRMQNSLL